MEETTNITSDVGTAPASESTQQSESTPQSEPVYTAHETDVTPDSGRTNRDIYPDADPNAPPELTPYEKLEKYRRQGQRDILEGDPSTWHDQIQQRKETGFESDQQPGEPPAFDLATAYDNFIAKPEDRGALPILTHLYESNQPAYVSLINDAILSNWQYAAALLANHGHIPEQYAPMPNMVDPTDPMLGELREDLREIALGLDPQLWEEVAWMSADARDRVLEGAAQLQRNEKAEQERQQRHEQAEQQRQQQAEKKAWEGVTTKGADSTNSIIDEHWAGHLLHLEQTFSPSGDKETNRRFHQGILGLATSQVMQDPEARAMDHNIYANSMHAAYARSVGDHSKALGHENNAKHLAKKLNARITEARDAYVNLLRNNFNAGHQPPAQEQHQYIN